LAHCFSPGSLGTFSALGHCFSLGSLRRGTFSALGHYSIFGSSGIVPALDCFAPFHSSKFFTMGLRLHDGSRVVGIILASPITIQSDDGPNTYFFPGIAMDLRCARVCCKQTRDWSRLENTYWGPAPSWLCRGSRALRVTLPPAVHGMPNWYVGGKCVALYINPSSSVQPPGKEVTK
jgi:hypothetical protein